MSPTGHGNLFLLKNVYCKEKSILSKIFPDLVCYFVSERENLTKTKITIMKKNLWIAAVLGCGAFVFTSCNDQTEGTGTTAVPQSIQEQFYQKFPDAKSVQWSSQDGYSIASFYMAADSVQNKCQAWFSLHDCCWDMTEYEIDYTLLPDSVRQTFEASEYAASPWQIDREIDVLERAGIETLYVISVTNAETLAEMDLYYSADGILLKEVLDGTGNGHHAEDFLPETPAATIDQWISNNFPKARIIDVETENGGTEVELISNGVVYEVLFSKEQNWMYTKQELRRSMYQSMPPRVLSALRTVTGFTGWGAVDDVDYYETAENGNFYCIEMEDRFGEEKIYISADGEIIEKPVLGGGQGQTVPVDATIEEWISSHYAGARIVDRDYDDGVLEIEFIHEGIKKTACFNGSGEWIYSEWDVAYSALPSAVMLTLQNNYADCSIERDDIQAVENASGLVYEIEMERRGSGLEKKVTIGADGTVLSERNDY